jgi:TolB-like protein/DNA-binding winged helix-turn-helix (wHTH) protein/Tfp pilus assembly protein PilF
VDGDFRVGPWLVEPSLNTVSRNGTTVHLEPKQMGVLVCLAEHPGEPLSKEKLLHSVWPDTFVSDDVLTRSIFELRRVFEDDARESRFIQTIPKRGYRLVAPVVPVNGTSGDHSAASWAGEPAHGGARWGSRTWRIGALAVVGIVLLCGLLFGLNAGGLLDRMLGKSDVPVIRSLAVLPLKNLSDDPEQKYFAWGMTEELITDLSQISALRVISRTSSEIYENTGKSLPEIAHELDVDAIVEGSVQRSGNRVRITAQLIYAPRDKNIWARTYERDLPDALALQSTVASAIAEEVRVQVSPNEQARLNAPHTVILNALDAYLEGNYHLDRLGKGFGDEEPRKAAQYFQRAINEDPNFAPAYIGLARAHQGLMRLSPRDYEIRKAAAGKAAALDPTSAEVHVLLAELHCDDWNWSQAEEEYRQAIALNPNSADAHDSLGHFLDATGRLDEGMKEFQRAQQLDPSYDHLAHHLSNLVGLDQAIQLGKHNLESHPDDGYAHWAQYQNYVLRGMYPQAVEEIGRTVRLFGHPEIAAHVDHAFATSGYPDAARVFAADLEKLQVEGEIYMPGILAEVYSTSGGEDRALYWLEDAYKHKYSLGSDGGLMWLKGNPMYGPLRSDPRFKDLVHRVGLPP